MEFLEPEKVKQAMNHLGGQGRPFVFAVDFEMTSAFIVAEPEKSREVFFRMPGQSRTGLDLGQADQSSQVWIKANPESLEVYAKKFEVVQRGLARGDAYLVNLTIKTPIECSHSLEGIYGLSDSPYLLYLPERFVSFSPETFVKITADGIISTYPMKGTIDAKVPEAEQVIMDDYKETAEHATVVDLLRNDLSLSATRVRVKRYRYIDRLKTSQREILQVSSEIVGQLGEKFSQNLGDIVFKTLPAGSVSGAPKESTLDIIRRAEEGPRGYYAGVFGYFDGRAFDSAVLIRFIEQENGQKYFRSGGGITALSGLEDEYKEALEKIYLPFRSKKAAPNQAGLV
ncbi:MAG: aminodeoxychorismate synthase component I [Deltaproteobacteria bacterium]|jgi:para-aminobenzoate synthetase component 1|nr:aminodeoxychorismate synthase component I [Deltaproteobacteria bacterium]